MYLLLHPLPIPLTCIMILLISGIATYVNGDTIDGNFISGRADGIVKYTFATTGAVNHAVYKRGLRVNFESKEKAKVMSTMALQYLLDDAAFSNSLAQNTGVANFGVMKRTLSHQPSL